MTDVIYILKSDTNFRIKIGGHIEFFCHLEKDKILTGGFQLHCKSLPKWGRNRLSTSGDMRENVRKTLTF
jgi:hypothetical protein